ncbi:MAG: enediyne biosynthesis protein [Acidobacteriaceae bacterium]|nr:enediyne biosynthesis protein [Acidobacteriaceae bacterium]
MLLAKNTGSKFVDVSAQASDIFRKAWVGRGLAIGDLDNDARLDAAVTGNDGGLYVLHDSTSTQNYWLTLLLVGHKSNRDAIGAEVKITTARGLRMATVTTAGSYLSSSDKCVHFGLASETAANIESRWPSGIRQTIKNVSVDKILRVDEPESTAPPGSVPAKRKDTAVRAAHHGFFWLPTEETPDPSFSA